VLFDNAAVPKVKIKHNFYVFGYEKKTGFILMGP
jgi:hypothetical protein